MAVLEVVQGTNPGTVYPLDQDSVVLGRHPECTIVLESASISRQHARVSRAEGKYYLEDLHSRNGTYLNGQPIFQRQLLHENDQISVCDLVFVFRLGPGDAPAPPLARQQAEFDPATLLYDDEQAGSTSTIMSKLSVAAGSSGLRLAVNPQAKLKALLEISQNLGKTLKLGEVLPKLLDSLFAIFAQADRGFIVLRDADTGRLVPKAVKLHQEQKTPLRISRTIINGVMATKEAILSADAANDARFDMAESIVDFHIRSVMCAPLIAADGQVLGAIQLDTLDRRNRFSREDLDLLASVAYQAAFAVENAQLHEAAMREDALNRELSVAHEVLRGFLPAGPPRVEQYEFFDYYEPARQLGGDYYDYIPLPGGRLGVVVADVSGKGIPASLLMARLSADTRYCLVSEPTPAEAVGRLNRVFCGSGWNDRFVTMVLAVLDPLRHEVTVVSAGHMPPVLRHGPGAIRLLDDAETCLPLGIERETVYRQQGVQLVPGNSLTLYTDGITEAMNAGDELYGFERLSAQLASDADRVGTLGRRILSDVEKFVGTHPQSDDMCLVCFGRKE